MSVEKPEFPPPANVDAGPVSRTRAAWWDFALQMMVASIVTLVVLVLFFALLFVVAPVLPDTNSDYLDVIVAAYILLTALVVLLATAAAYALVWFVRKRVHLRLIHQLAALLSLVVTLGIAFLYSTADASLSITSGTVVAFSLLAVWGMYLIRSRVRACKPAPELLTGY